MDAHAFHALATRLRESPGLASKADIGGVAKRLGLNDRPAGVPVGDDCAAIADGDGHLLFAIEGFMNEFLEQDPWFAGWCGVMVNLSDIAAMGGRPLAVVDAVWSSSEEHMQPVLDGLRAASAAYGVPIVGGHTNVHTPQAQLAVAVLGRAGSRLLTSFDARPGDALICVVDHRGAYREPFNNWQAALDAPPERLRADLALLADVAERGLSCAAKDISQGGIPGTAVMLAESSGVGIDIDLDAIPLPTGVTLERWLATFPSFGFLIAAPPRNARAILDLFGRAHLTAAVIGKIVEGSEVAVTSGELRAIIRDHAAETLMGLRPTMELAS
ncbi:MAG: selenophosphate synthetase-related protein [Hyphomicrobiales bacterium]|nr:selenophosphate synthetase-related protein [Hyphomicrobiales bacterium]